MSFSKTSIAVALSLSLINALAGAVNAQGISEMGAAHAMGATLGSGLHSQAGATGGGLNSIYGNLNKQMNNVTSGGSSGGASGGGGGGLDVLGDPIDPRVTVQNAGKDSNHLFDMAVQKQRAGKNVEAEKLYRQSLAIRQNIWGARDPAVPRLISTIAELQRKRGDLAGAETSYHDLLKMQLKTSGAGSYELVPILEKLGLLCLVQKKYTEADNYLLQVYTQRSRKGGVDAKDTVKAALELAQNRTDANDLPGAAEVLKPSVDLLTSKNTTSPEFVKLLQAYAGVLKKQNKADELSQVESKLQSLNPGPVAKSEAPGGAAPAIVDAAKAGPDDAIKSEVKPTVPDATSTAPATKPADTIPGTTK